MAKKKLTLAELREHAQDIDQHILQTRKLLESYATERAKIFSPENRRRLSEAGLKEDEAKLKARTEPLLAQRNGRIAQSVREAFADKDTWSKEYALRTSRFAPENNGNPQTEAAQLKAVFNEVMETFKRGNAENRAARYTTADLIAETERAALEGDVAVLQVLSQESRNRKLAGLERANFDMAFSKLQVPELTEAADIFSEIEGLATEADALFRLWREPTSESALGGESLGRFNRRRKAEELIKRIESEAQEQSSAA